MMYFPRPYPDESCWSLHVRAARHLGLSLDSAARIFTANRRRKFELILPLDLTSLAEIMDIETERLLLDHTFFPYVTAFMSSAGTEAFKDALIIQTATGVADYRAATIRAFRFTSPRRYCTQCASEDQQLFGESYWHRMHAIPGVLVCARHKKWLSESDVPTGFRDGPRYRALPYELSAEKRCEKKHFPILFRIADKSISLLNPTLRRYDDLPWIYQSQTTMMKYNSLLDQRQREKLLLDITCYIGETVFSMIRVTRPGASAFKPCQWPINMITNTKGAHFTPLQHVLLQLFLFRSKHEQLMTL
jgi:TniQ